MQQSVDRYMKGWRGDLWALFAGGIAVLAFAPFSLFPLAIISPLILFIAWGNLSPKRAAWRGWLYGLGLFGFGVSWLAIPVATFGGLDLISSIVLTGLFISVLALYFAGLGFAVVYYFPACEKVRLLLILPAAWTLVEWLRSWLFTGFPWLLFGYSQIDSPLAGYAPLFGVYGVTWVTIFSATLLLFGMISNTRLGWKKIGGLFVLMWVLGAVLTNIEWGRKTEKTLDVALIQASIPQELKYQPSQKAPSLQRYLSLSKVHHDADLIIWPETAIPVFEDEAEDTINAIEEMAFLYGLDFLVGIPKRETLRDVKTLNQHERYYNSVMQISRKGIQFYYKQHLVPFGEYLPFRQELDFFWKHIHIPFSDYHAGGGNQPLLKFKGIAAGIAICYEDAFSNEMQRHLTAAGFLINVSNDGWFGDSLAPHQHLQIARMRAKELGRYLLRSANTGITAIIDPHGNIVKKSKQFEEYVIRAKINAYEGGSLYALSGNVPLLLIMIFCLFSGVILSRYWCIT